MHVLPMYRTEPVRFVRAAMKRENHFWRRYVLIFTVVFDGRALS